MRGHLRELLSAVRTFDNEMNLYMTIIYKEEGNLYHVRTRGKQFGLSNLKGTLILKNEIWPLWNGT